MLYTPSDNDIGSVSLSVMQSDLGEDNIEVVDVTIAPADIGYPQITESDLASVNIGTESLDLATTNLEAAVPTELATAVLENLSQPPVETGIERIVQDYTDKPGERSQVDFHLYGGDIFSILVRNGLNGTPGEPGKDGKDAILPRLTLDKYMELRKYGKINLDAIYPIYDNEVLTYVYFGKTLVMRKAKGGEEPTISGVFPLTFPIIFT